MLPIGRFAGPVLILGAVFGTYIGLIDGGNFLQDDYGQVTSSKLTYFQQVEAWAPLWGFRPVSLLVMSFFIQTFEHHWVLYAITNLSLFAVAIWAYFFKVHPFKKQTTKWLALGTAAMPAMASTLVFSPVNQLSATLSLALAGLGHVFLHSSNLGKCFRGALAIIAFSSSLLAYEISLPLLLWTVLSAHFNDKGLGPKGWKPLFRISLPVTVSLAIAVFWQKLIAPILLGAGESRLSSVSLLAGATWLYALAVSLLPQLLSAAIAQPMLLAMALIGGFICTWLMLLPGEPRQSKGHSKLVASSVALLSTSFLFVGSGHAADLNGYLNRGLSSTWILLVIFVALALEQLTIFPIGAGVIALLLASANFLWFNQKIEENTAAGLLRDHIVEEIVSSRSLIPPNASILVDVPCILPGGKFDTDVFCSSWDLKGALEIHGLRIERVLTLWDVSFKSNFQELPEHSPVYLMQFNDSGRLQQSFEIRKTDTLTNPFGRTLGGREFDTLDCLTLVRDVHPSESWRRILKCIVNPI